MTAARIRSVTALVGYLAIGGLAAGCVTVGCLSAGWLFGQEPETAERSRYDGTPRDAVDASAPHDAEAARRLRTVETLLRNGSWDLAQELLMYTLENFGGSLVRGRDGQLLEVTDEVALLLARLPAETQNLHRQKYEGVAARLLTQGRQSGRRVLVDQAATQFPFTAAGRQAAEYLARLQLDRGQWGLAAQRFAADIEQKPQSTPRDQARLLVALAAAGQGEAARKMLDELPAAERTAVLGALPAGFGLEQWLALDSVASAFRTPATQWPLPFGDASRTALAADGEPLLLRRWFHPSTNRREVAEHVERVVLELRDANQAAIPAAIPLTVGARAIMRTLHGAAVLDLDSGKLLWETEEGLSAERILAGGTALEDQDLSAAQALRVGFGPDPWSNSTERNRLSQLLFRDGVYGMISADAERLYVVEDQAILLSAERGYRGAQEGQDPLNRNLAANRLAAYDLNTGRKLWTVPNDSRTPSSGNPAPALGGDSVDQVLQRVAFYGPPTPAGNELYAIGEHDKEVRLYAVDAATGRLNWQRLLAYSQTGIDQDIVRRWWPAQVAVANGVIVCPTTAGWLLGIDQVGHNILWAYRFSPPQPNRGSGDESPMVRLAELNRRWLPSAPMIQGGRVLFTPPEEPRLVCVDLYTGELQWQHGKSNSLYLAGISGDLAVVVGEAAVTGLDLADGGTRWSIALPSEVGLPSGRGVLTADRLFLPLRGETLWTIDLEEGLVTDRRTLTAGPGTLGNLLLHRGTLLSQGPAGLTAFEEREGLLARIDSELKQNPTDAAVLLKQAALRRAEGDLAAAAASLDAADVTKLAGAQRSGARALLTELLLHGVRSEPVESAAVLDHRLGMLASLATTPEQHLAVLQIDAERALAAEDFERALTIYLNLLDTFDGSLTLSSDGGVTVVQLDAWLAARLTELSETAPEAVQQTLTAAVKQRFDAATDTAQRSRLSAVFAFDRASVAVVRALAAEDVAAGRFFSAEVRLLGLRDAPWRAVAAAALLDLAKLAAQVDLPEDAQNWLARLDAQFGTDLPKELSAQVEELRIGLSAQAPGMAVDWGDFTFNVVRSGSYSRGEQVTEVRPMLASLPYFRRRLLRYSAAQSRLSLLGPGGMPLERSLVLRNGPSGGTLVGVPHAIGHQLVLNQGGSVQAVAPLEGEVVWTAPALTEQRYVSSRSTRGPMRPAAGIAEAYGLLAVAGVTSSLQVANANYVAILDRRTLQVLDTRTGRVRWSRTNVPRGSIIVGTPSTLYLSPAGGEEPQALRATDGSVRSMPNLREHLRNAVIAAGDRLLLVSAAQPGLIFGLRRGLATVTLLDPVTARTIWTREFGNNALFDQTDDGRLVVLDPDGTLVVLDTETGQPQPLGTLPKEAAGTQDVYGIYEPDATFIFINRGAASNGYSSSEVSSLPVNGHVYAFDRLTGKALWQREVRGQRLYEEELAAMPVLLFVSGKYVEKGGNRLVELDLLALDKRTGQPRLDTQAYTTYPPYLRSLTVDTQAQSIELNSYNSRLRLQAVPRQAAPVQPAAVGPVATKTAPAVPVQAEKPNGP